MKKLTRKTFLLLLTLSLSISFIGYVCISLFLPYTRENQAQQKTQQLISKLRLVEKQESESLFTNYIKETRYDIFLFDAEHKAISPYTFKEISTDFNTENLYPFRFASGEEYVLVVDYNDARSMEIKNAIQKSLPLVAVITVILSMVSAWIFSRYTTRPIIRINRIADKIADLDFSWYCPDVRDDEIGMLSKSINVLSDKLHCALDELYSRNRILEDEITLEKERERRRMLFFAGVSHELKTPIAIVIGQLEGMQANIGVYKDRDKYLARSSEILLSLNAFIKEVLTVSHLDISEEKVYLPVNVSTMLQSLVDEYSVFIEQEQIEISTAIEHHVTIYADELLIKKALGNIISNGVTHTPVGGKLHICLTHTANMAKLVVINTPAHIDDQHLPHLFEAFYRADQSSKHSSGLGLYITRMIFETYNISHCIENYGDGVRFTVLLEEASV